MGETIRADAALLAAVQAGDSATLHTAAGAEISWAALHLLAQHGFRWKPEYPDDAAHGPVGTRLHVELTIEHPARPGIVLGTTAARFLARALDVDIAFSLAEGLPPLELARMTAMAERRSPRAATFVVTGTHGAVVGGVLTVERGPRTVFETLRCTVAVPGALDRIDGFRGVRDGLEAGLQSVMLGRHPQSALFSTSRGRADGVVDTAIAGPPAPLGVFSGVRAARASGLLERRRELGGHLVGPAHAPGLVIWFHGTERERWAAAAGLGRRLGDLRADAMHPEALQRDRGTRDDGTRTGGER